MQTSFSPLTLSVALSLALAGAGLQAHAQELPDAPSTVSARAAQTLAAADNTPADIASADIAADDPHSSSSDRAATPQQSKDPALPSTTDAKPAQASDADGKQTKRILGIVPNFRSVSADTKLPPMSVKDKFIEASQDNFDYSSIFLPAFIAWYSWQTGATPEFGGGGLGYGRYLWHSVVDQTSENYWVEFIVPSLTHEDPRFYTLGKNGKKKRAIYAVTRVFITRTDNGGSSFNYSEILGAGAAAALSNAYYPAPERTASKTVGQMGTNIGIDAFTFLFKEFWPNINQALFHGKE